MASFRATISTGPGTGSPSSLVGSFAGQAWDPGQLALQVELDAVVVLVPVVGGHLVAVADQRPLRGLLRLQRDVAGEHQHVDAIELGQLKRQTNA